MLKKNKGIMLAIAVGACIFIGVSASVMHLKNTSNNKEEQSKDVSKSEENPQSQEDGKDKEETTAKSEEKEDTDTNKSESKSTDKVESTANTSKPTTDTKSNNSTSSKTFTKVKGGGDYTKTLNAINSILDDPNLLDGSTMEMKSKVNQEYELWDGYLNEIYKVISYNLPDDMKQDLTEKESAWIKEKESKAKLAGDQYKGGTAEELARSISEAKSTKDRCYELINTYMVTTD